MFCDGPTTEEGLELNLFFLTACRKPYYPHSVLANSLRPHEPFQPLSTVLYMWSLTVRPRPPKMIQTYYGWWPTIMVSLGARSIATVLSMWPDLIHRLNTAT